MKNSLKRSLAAFAVATGGVAGLAAPSLAATVDGETYSYEVTDGTAANAVGVITAAVVGDMVNISVAVDGLGLDSVVMHFHEGASCDAMGAIKIAAPPGTTAGATPVATTDGNLRFTTTQPVGDADMENVYYNIHEAATPGNVVACGTLAEATVTNYTKAAGDAAGLTVTNTLVGTTSQTEVNLTGSPVDAVQMHFHTGLTCDAMGAIVLQVGADTEAVTDGALNKIYVAEALNFDPANVYYNTHQATDLGNVVACATVAAEEMGPKTVAAATTLQEIIDATDYDVSTDPEILRLYQAFFNREADVAGAKYWIGQRDTNSALAIAQSFPNASAEFQNQYADAANNDEFLTRVYDNILNRTPDQGGFDYWIDILQGTNDSGENTEMKMGDRGQVVFYVAVNQEFINNFPYLPAG